MIHGPGGCIFQGGSQALCGYGEVGDLQWDVLPEPLEPNRPFGLLLQSPFPLLGVSGSLQQQVCGSFFGKVFKLRG